MARLMPMSRRLRQEYFTGTLSGTQQWTCPPGVTLITRMVGKGQDGQPYTWQTQTIDLAQSYRTSVGAGTQQVLRADLQNFGATQANNFGSGTGIRTVTYNTASYVTNDQNLTGISVNGPYTKTVRSTYTVSSSGGGLEYFTYANAGADYYRISIQVDVGGTTGANTTALGRIFYGGAGGSAAVLEYTNTVVVPGTVYTFSIPIGGYVQLYYY